MVLRGIEQQRKYSDMLNKFFKKNNTEECQEEYFDESKIAGVTYFVGVDGKVQVDVEIFDYNNESLNGLSKVLNILSKDNCYMQTLSMIQEHFVKEQQEEALVSIYEQIASQVPSEKNVQVFIDKSKQRPCIRPSDML